MKNLIPENKDIFDRIKESLNTDRAELELLINKNTIISRDTFIKLLNKFKELKYKKLNIPEMLDIRTLFKTKSEKSILSHTRASIIGLSSIKKYCDTDDLELVERYNIPEGSTNKNVIYIQKSNYYKKNKADEKVFFNGLVDDEYNFKVNLKREVVSNQYNIEQFKQVWQDKQKMFRYKKRFSFVSRDNLFRID